MKPYAKRECYAVLGIEIYIVDDGNEAVVSRGHAHPHLDMTHRLDYPSAQREWQKALEDGDDMFYADYEVLVQGMSDGSIRVLTDDMVNLWPYLDSFERREAEGALKERGEEIE